MFFQMVRQRLAQLQVRQDFFVPLKELNGVPAEVILVHLALDGFLDVGDGVFHAAGEDVGQLASLVGLGQGHGLLGSRLATLALQGTHFHDLTAQGRAQLGKIDGVAVLPDQVDHVDRHHNGPPQFDKLGGEIQVPLNIGAVYNVQNGIRLLVHQIASGHHFLQSIGRQGVNAGQVLDNHILVALQLALFLFNRDAGPIAHVLIGAGQGIEQGRLTAVRIARQRDLDLHGTLLSKC